VNTALPFGIGMLVLCALHGPALAQSEPAKSGPKSDSHVIERLVPPSSFHGVHGLTFDANDALYAGSVVGESIYRVDTQTGNVETVIGPPQGMADDLVFMPDGTLVWTAISQGVVRARKPDGPVQEIAKLVSVNSVNVRRSDGRLFVGQVFGGDGVWELDPSGKKRPRSIVKNPGGFNGFDIGPDGKLYGPLWFRHQVVSIDPDSGELEVIADGFETPAAANFDSRGNLYVLDTARGELVRVDIRTGAKHVVTTVATSVDNLAIDSKDRIFVSNMADNGIQEIDRLSGAIRQVVIGMLATPVGIACVSEGDRDLLYVADVFALRRIDTRQRSITDLARSHAKGTKIGYPIAVSANERHLILTNSEGPVQRYDRRTMELLQSWSGLHGVQNAIELPDGSLVLAHAMTGELSRLPAGQATAQSPQAPTEIATGLGAPLGLAVAGPDAVYVSEMSAGRIRRLNVASGDSVVVTDALQRPQGIAVASDGGLLVVEAGRRQLTRVDPGSGKVSVIASELPIGIPNGTLTTAAVAVNAKGTIYVTSDAENSIWYLHPKPPQAPASR
jgi:sugar lactone lactonase YvrE